MASPPLVSKAAPIAGVFRLSWSESLGEPKVLVVELLFNEHPVLPTFRLSLLLQFGLNIVTFSSIPQWATR